MLQTLFKVLSGVVIGALLVGLLMHARAERARHAPAMGPPGGMGAAGAVAGPAAGAAAGRPSGPAMSGGAPPGAHSQAPVAVIAIPARGERLSLAIEALGSARANEAVDISSKVSNLITAVRFEEGQQVRKGQVLVELDGAQASAELSIAEAEVGESRSQFKRSRELYTTKVLSDAQLEQIEATLKANEARVLAARSRLGDTVIRAPFAGRVGLRRVSVGSLVGPGTVITTLDDTSMIKLDFTVAETFLSSVRPGLAVTAHSAAFPDRTFTGNVASTDSRVDPNTRSFAVRALLPNASGQLKPGMFLTVRMARAAVDAVLVPEHALVPEQGDVYVFVIRDGVAQKRRVLTGARQVGTVQITDGLAVGELVVTEGTQKLRDGVPVNLLEAPATAPALAQEAQGAS